MEGNLLRYSIKNSSTHLHVKIHFRADATNLPFVARVAAPATGHLICSPRIRVSLDEAHRDLGKLWHETDGLLISTRASNHKTCGRVSIMLNLSGKSSGRAECNQSYVA